MQILSLTLSNTKSYEHGHVAFAEGVNAIVGHNGAGKSTILEAIGFVLFDALGYKYDDFVREGADSAEITVVFHSSVDDRVYHVIRRCGASTQYRIFDPELQLKVCEGRADVLRFLRRQMGVEAESDLPSLFRDAVGVPQGAFTAIFLDTPSRRKPTFDRLLQVEEYGRAADRLREPATLLRERRQALDVEIATLTARLERLSPLQDAIQQRQRELAVLTTRLAQQAAHLAVVESQRIALERTQQTVTTLHNQRTQAEARIQTLAAQVEAAALALRQAEQARTLVQEQQAGYDQYLAAQASRQALDAQARQRQQLERQRAELARSLAQVEAALDAANRELATVAEAETTVAALSPALAEQNQLEQTLALAQQKQTQLDDATQQVATHQQQVARLTERLTTLGNQLAQVAGLESQILTMDQEIAARRSAVDAAKEQLASFKHAADAIAKQNQALADVSTALCPVCEQPLSETHRRAMLARNETRIGEMRAEYKQVAEQIKRDEAAQSAQEAARQQAQKALMRLPRADEHHQVAQELQEAESVLQKATARVDTLQGATKEIADLQQQLAALGNPRRRFDVATTVAARRSDIERQRRAQNEQRATLEGQLGECDAALGPFADLDQLLDKVGAELRDSEPAYQAVLTHRQLAASVEERSAELTQRRTLHGQAVAEAEKLAAELAAVAAQFDPAALERAVGEERQLRADQAALNAQQTLLQRQQQADEQECALLQAQEAELAEQEATKSRIQHQEETLAAMRDLLKKAGPQVTKALIQQVSSRADEFFCDMMQDYTRRLIWHDDYGISLEVEGRRRQFAQLSGGEQMCAALAVRLALLREMSNINVAFFDEPTTNLDETRRDSLARQILDIRGFRQLFVISHDDTFEQATQHLIRIERVNGASMIVGGE